MGRSKNIPPLEFQIKRMKTNVASVIRKRGQAILCDFALLTTEKSSASSCKYGSCVYSYDNNFDCTWLRETFCETRCVGRAVSNRAIGVDSRKIKYRETPDEVLLKKRVRKFLKVAVEIDKQENEKEKKAIKAMRKRKIKKVMEEIDKYKLNEADIVGGSPYKIKSLI